MIARASRRPPLRSFNDAQPTAARARERAGRRTPRRASSGHIEARRDRRGLTRDVDRVPRRVVVRADAADVPLRHYPACVSQRGSRADHGRGASGRDARSQAAAGPRKPVEYQGDLSGGCCARGSDPGTTASEGMTGPQMRIGNGFDVHALVAGRRLVLGGVTIPHERGLAGHSDADVLLHAICDAILGALAAGDIGVHFPDTDAAYKDADSRALLRRVWEHASAAGYSLGNIGTTIIAPAPG